MRLLEPQRGRVNLNLHWAAGYILNDKPERGSVWVFYRDRRAPVSVYDVLYALALQRITPIKNPYGTLKEPQIQVW